jgi:hypothetical protein
LRLRQSFSAWFAERPVSMARVDQLVRTVPVYGCALVQSQLNIAYSCQESRRSSRCSAIDRRHFRKFPAPAGRIR